MQSKIFYSTFLATLGLIICVECFLFFILVQVLHYDFSNLIPYFLFSTLLAILSCFFLAQFLAIKLIKPIQTLDLAKLDKDSYPELYTLIHQIQSKNQAINSQFKHLKQKKQELQSLTQNLRDGLIFINRSGKILSANTSAKKYFKNLNKIENILELDNAQFLKLLLTQLKMFKKGKILKDIRENFSFHDTENLECEIVFSPIFSQKSKLKGMLIILCDITELKYAQNLRKEFSANVTHELKTPLTSILASTEMIKNNLVSQEDLPNFIDKIHFESKRLLAMINEILKLSFLDEMHTLPFSKVNLKAVVLRVIKHLEFFIQKDSIILELDLQDSYIKGIDALLENLIFNLCDNAIKYNKKGGLLKIKLMPFKDSIQLHIEDSGIGIPKEFEERIFERFFCVDRSKAKKIGGSGLGLSIVKSILKLHNAKISVKSEENVGSCFIVSFPKSQININ